MAFTLISIITLAGIAIAVPVPQNTGVTACKFTYWSQAGDTCRSIGLPWGYYDTDILAANSFLNCDDIWVNTPICIPDIPTPVTVTYPNPGPSSSISATPIPLPTPVCQQSIISVAGENCDSIGSRFGVTGADILAANSFLDCANICKPLFSRYYSKLTLSLLQGPVPRFASQQSSTNPARLGPLSRQSPSLRALAPTSLPALERHASQLVPSSVSVPQISRTITTS